MRTIKWQCTVGPGWQWLGEGPNHPGFPTDGDTVREGTIKLPSNADYWYTCIDLVLQGVTVGIACLRSFSEDGVDKIQARTVAQNHWSCQGEVSAGTSFAKSDGGIDLLVQFADF
jgi:hypothetical protein